MTNDEKLLDTEFFRREKVNGKDVLVCIANYTSLLSFKGEDVNETLRSLSSKKNNQDLEEQLLVLLKSNNWRAHIVCLPFFFWLPNITELIDAAWELMRKGSWCYPQILAVLTQTDAKYTFNLENFKKDAENTIRVGDSSAKAYAFNILKFIEKIKDVENIDLNTKEGQLLAAFATWRDSAADIVKI